jgi:hypothetical protein
MRRWSGGVVQSNSKFLQIHVYFRCKPVVVTVKSKLFYIVELGGLIDTFIEPNGGFDFK